MKKILASLVLTLTLVANAQLTVVSNNVASGVFINRAIVLNSLVLTSSTNAILKIYDGPTTNVIGAFTNYTVFVTNKVTSFVSPTTGLTNTWTNQVLYTLVQSQAASTNNVTPLISTFVTANQAPMELDVPLIFTRDMRLVVDTGGVNVIANYRLP